MLFSEPIYSQIGNFENSFSTKFSRRIKLPKMDEYPLEYFSNSRLDFSKAQLDFPKLKTQFEKMLELRKALDSNSTKQIVRWTQSALERNINTKTACIQIIFECKKVNLTAAEKFIDNLCIF